MRLIKCHLDRMHKLQFTKSSHILYLCIHLPFLILFPGVHQSVFKLVKMYSHYGASPPTAE
uniref:Putative ovule protein n=1 Tax=Solanum chacoense TaxID=4108 RepID=A0A0V0GR61_SOLCH